MLFDQIRSILMELMDLGADEIGPDSYLVRDLNVESIDFLELAATLNDRFRVGVHDDTVFLRNLRLFLAEAAETRQAPLSYLQARYTFLAPQRLEEIILDLEVRPVLKVKDLVSYIQWQQEKTQTA